MMYLRRTWRVGRIAFLALAGWLAVHGAAWAQEMAVPKKDEAGGGGSYIVSYFLVILGVAFGLLFVCRSSNRRDRARPEQYGEAKAAVKK